jgi:hypothetical protein
VSSSCHAGGKTFTKEVEVGENISISQANFAKDVKNKGIISNSTIGSEATLTGGKLSGYIINEGTIADIHFVGAKLEGGTLSGYIVNIVRFLSNYPFFMWVQKGKSIGKSNQEPLAFFGR